jgi:DNA-directed RNA polymerase subunit RPC12/RpoP
MIHARVVSICMNPIMAEGETNTILETERLIGCPKCSARLPFQRSSVVVMDSCGFESYSLECDQCGAQLVGVIDPIDDKLLLSELES